MTDSDVADSPLDVPAGGVGHHATEAFSVLGNETRLSILLALWEAFEPLGEENAVSFSDLRERVGVQDSGQFNYHLSQLTEQFVRATDSGYELRESGQKLIRTVIAGTGIEESELGATEIGVACNRCGSTPVELSYIEEMLYLTCPSCKGFITHDRFPRGTLAIWHLDPAGLHNRRPSERFLAGAIAENNRLRMMMAGVCPDCSGTIERSVQLCEEHATDAGEVCPNCGTRDSARVRYVCAVCKNWNGGPVQVITHDHPDVISFYHDRGVSLTYDIDDVEGFYDLWEHLWRQEHTIVSTEPLQIRVTIPCDGDELHVLLDDALDIVTVDQKRYD